MTQFSKYILRRIATVVVLVTLVICFTFFIFKLPVILGYGSPISLYFLFPQLDLRHCLDTPPQELIDYWSSEFGLVSNPDVFDWIYMLGKFVAKSFTGQFGISTYTQEPISLGLIERLPYTLLLAISIIIISAIFLRIKNNRTIGNHNFETKMSPLMNFSLSATIFVEVTLKTNGIGRWFFSSVIRGDFPVMQACFILLSVMAILVTIIADILSKYMNDTRKPYECKECILLRHELTKTRTRMYLLDRKNGEGIDPSDIQRG